MDLGRPQARLGGDAAPLREADRLDDRRDAPAAGRLRHLASTGPVRVALLVGLLLVGGYTSIAICKGISFLAFGATPSKLAVETPLPGPGQPGKSVIQLRYFSYHPFNLIYRMSAQTLFGLPGETVGRIPLLYSSYEFEVVLRTVNGSSSTPRNWTDLPTFTEQEPTASSMYMAAQLTLPRATLLYSWMHDYNGAYKLVRNMEVDVLESADKLTMGWLRRGLQTAGLLSASNDSHASVEAVSCPTVEGPSPMNGTCGMPRAAGKFALGLRLWPLALLCPGIVTCFVALALVETAPIAAGWVLLTSALRAGCELRVLVHTAGLVWQRRPQAAVQCLACSHGVPFMLGCHALLLLRLAAALLPARAFFLLAFHLYGTWAPLAAAAIMIMALQPNNGQFLEGAMDGIRHLGHRAAEDFHAAANGAVATASVTLKRRQHWPPPVNVPAELQETAETAPKHLLCPITHHILTEPAVTSTGATYERSAIVEWLAKAGKDPLTGHSLTADEVFPNLAMYTLIEEYVRECTKARQGAPTPSASH